MIYITVTLMSVVFLFVSTVRPLLSGTMYKTTIDTVIAKGADLIYIYIYISILVNNLKTVR